MKVKEIFEGVGNWYRENFSDQQKFKGAFFSGSITELGLDYDFPIHSSDVDIRIVVDTDFEVIDYEKYPDGKYIYYNGFIIQSNYLPVFILESKEDYLTSTSVGSNLRDMI